jgi:hypothetical protein
MNNASVLEIEVNQRKWGTIVMYWFRLLPTNPAVVRWWSHVGSVHSGAA